MDSDRTKSPSPAQRSAKPRLHFLDGLRALACVYVLLFHEATVKVVGHGEPSPLLQVFLPRLNRGRFGVVFFIVLSGFSLMLPVARAGEMQLVGGFGSYLYRRARRILPPYYAALVLSIAVIAVYNALAARQGMGPPVDAALTPGSILSHALLFHNLKFDWAYRINGPMWSVATEWQIYFVFPALLLPLWRWAGGVVAVAAAWIVGSLPFFLLPSEENFFWASPWFVGSFALGMAGAVIGFSPDYRDSALRNRVPWRWLTVACFVVLAGIVATGRADSWPFPVIDLVVSGLAFCMINDCVQRSTQPGRPDWFSSFLSSKALVYVGGFSYSLYLVQHPVLRFTEKALNRMPLSYDANVVVHLLLVTPLVMAVAWVFSELFERPFTTGAVLWPALQRRLRLAPPEAS
jgi:peptidoglycan/LPS O-acetylase OafA/YrhL